VLLRKIILIFCKEGNQIPALLRSGILRCKKKPSLSGLGFFISLSLRLAFNHQVELVGFEPTSKHIRRKLSTCLF
jgi:hypothetical protein